MLAAGAASCSGDGGGGEVVRVDVVVWKSLASSVQRARVTAHLMTSRHPTHRHHLVRSE